MSDARDFARLSSRKSGPGHFGFGLDKVRAVAALRALADAIEADGAGVQLSEVEIASKAQADDFAMFRVTLEYAIPVNGHPAT